VPIFSNISLARSLKVARTVLCCSQMRWISFPPITCRNMYSLPPPLRRWRAGLASSPWLLLRWPDDHYEIKMPMQLRCAARCDVISSFAKILVIKTRRNPVKIRSCRDLDLDMGPVGYDPFHTHFGSHLSPCKIDSSHNPRIVHGEGMNVS